MQWRKNNISRPDNDVTGVTNDGNIVASPPPLTTPAVSKKSHPWNTDFELENSELDLSVFNSVRGEEQIRSEKSMDEKYDAACDAIEDVEGGLDAYKEEMCSSILQPRNAARSSWTYINTKEDSKDKYMIELPVTFKVPNDFYVKAKRGNGPKQVNKY